MRKEDACGSDCGCESPLKTGQHRNINNAQYTKGAKNPEKLHATASVERAECFHKIADLISKDLPWIPLYNKAGIAGVSDKVQNFVCDYRGITFQIEKWNIAE